MLQHCWQLTKNHCESCHHFQNILHAWQMPLAWWSSYHTSFRWCHQMITFSMLLALCEGNSPVTGEFPSERPVTRSFDVFFDLSLNEGWVSSREDGDLRCHPTHYDVIIIHKNIWTQKCGNKITYSRFTSVSSQDFQFLIQSHSLSLHVVVVCLQSLISSWNMPSYCLGW